MTVETAADFCKTFGHTPKMATGLNISFCKCCAEMLTKQEAEAARFEEGK